MKLSLLLHVLHHLRVSQIIAQVAIRVRCPRWKELEAPAAYPLNAVPFIVKRECYKGNNTFNFLNLSALFPGWSDTTRGMLWAYNLNYMDWLLQENCTPEEGKHWVNRFIDELSANTIGLDPYPIALRTINWVKFISMHRDEFDEETLATWNNYLYSQLRLLEKKLEFHLLGNHLLEDAYALLIGSIYFREERMFKRAETLLRRELLEQILPDGAHYEQSAMYHCILLDRLLDVYNCSCHNLFHPRQKALNVLLKEKAIMMLGHLESVAYADGTIPLFNDAAEGIAPTPSELRAYAVRLGIQWQPIPMKECGYRRMRNETMEATIDVGNIQASYQPGHSHADTFSYELRIEGEPFIVDTGTSTYDKNARRQYERSTVSHNTVTVGNRDSSEVWSGFRIGNRAVVNVSEDLSSLVKASHDGFGQTCKHERHFQIRENDFMVADKLPLHCEAISHIHLAPSVEVLSFDTEKIVTTMCTIFLKGAQAVEVAEDFISKEFNRLLLSKSISITFTSSLSLIFKVVAR